MCKKLFPLLTLVTISVLTSSSVSNRFGGDNLPQSGQITRLKIVGMADLHGNFIDYDYIRKRPVIGGLPYVYSFLQQERKDTTQHVVFLNAGDILQGQLATYYYNYRDQRDGYMPAVFLNKAGLDASVLGNHDLEIGLPLLNRFIQELNSDVVVANVIYKETKELFTKPYTILHRNGLRIAVLGLTTPIRSECTTVQLTDELDVLDMFEVTQYWMKRIREEEKPDLIIGLFHAGYSDETDTIAHPQNCFRVNDPLYIAEQIPGFDALVLAHLHKLVINRIANVAGDSVWLIEPGYGGRDIAVLDFEIQKLMGQKAKIINSSAEIVNVFETQKVSTDIAEFATEKEIMRALADEKITILADTIYNIDAFFGSSFFVDLVHRVQLERTGADVSFAAPLSSNVVIPAGPITFSDLHRLYRFENTLTIFKMSGSEIKGYLEYSYNLWINQMNSPNSRLLRTMDVKQHTPVYLNRTFEIPQYFFDSGAGLDYEVDVTKPFGERIRIIRMWNDQPFEENKMYSVVTNAYRFSGAGGHLFSGAGIKNEDLADRVIHNDHIQVRELIRRKFSQQNEVKSFQYDNWKFIPEEYVKPAIEREYMELQ